MTRSRTRRISTLFIAAAAAAAVAAPSAQAGPLVASATCESKPMSQIFLPWADPANYFLADGGDFEGGNQGWSYGAADQVAGNEPFQVTSDDDGTSLAIPAGYRATSGTECVGLTEPTVRFFAKGPVGGRLDVTVVFEDAAGNVQRAPAGSAVGNGAWNPTTQMVILPALLPLLPGETTPVQFEFKASAGSWRIDDVYVDPFRRT